MSTEPVGASGGATAGKGHTKVTPRTRLLRGPGTDRPRSETRQPHEGNLMNVILWNIFHRLTDADPARLKSRRAGSRGESANRHWLIERERFCVGKPLCPWFGKAVAQMPSAAINQAAVILNECAFTRLACCLHA